jgi:hypothetical protein
VFIAQWRLGSLQWVRHVVTVKEKRRNGPCARRDVEKAYGGVQVDLQSGEISVLVASQRSDSHLRLTSGERDPSTHKIGGWVGPQNLDFLEEIIMPSPRRESKKACWVDQLVVQSLYQLSYTGLVDSLLEVVHLWSTRRKLEDGISVYRIGRYKVVQIWPGQTVTCLHTNSPGHMNHLVFWG